MSDTKMYTQGNWSVSRQTVDTIAPSTKTHSYAYPALDYVNDYAIKSDEPGESILINTTADGIDPKELIRYGYTDVDDVYKRVTGLKVPTAERAAMRDGVQTLVEVKHLYHAVNSVSGEEITLPAVARLTVVLPTHCAITNDVLNDIVGRVGAACFATSASSTPTAFDRVEQCAKGQLKPTGLN